MTDFQRKQQIPRTPEDDAMCLRMCVQYTYTHDMACPYTQKRWAKQGVETSARFAVATPREIREETLLAKTSKA